MTDERKNRVCPVEIAGSLDNRFRRWFQNPWKILFPYIREGMTVVDLGCGPGFFTIDMARMAGPSGRVIAADLQEGMLVKIREKIAGTDLADRITLHKCEADRIGLSDKADFILMFYMVHEVPDQTSLFKELYTLLNSEGRIYLIEPPVHVSKRAFEKTLETAEEAGFTIAERPPSLINKKVILKRR